MTQDPGFRGNQLRLSAILQVAGRIPRAPIRLRPHRQAAPSRQHLQDTHDQPIANFDPSEMSTPKGSREASLEFVQEFDTPVQPSVHFPIRLSTAAPESNVTTESDTHDQNMHGTSHLLRSASLSSSPTKRKKMAHCVEKKMSVEVLHTCRMHQPPPDNGLALVRASTDVGLPLPGCIEVSFTNPIAEVDPIQDSSIDIAPNRTRFLRDRLGTKVSTSTKKHRAVHFSINVSHQAAIIKPPHSTSVVYQSSTFLRPPVQNQRPKKSFPGGPSALCDGFTASEMHFAEVSKTKIGIQVKGKSIDTTANKEDPDPLPGEIELRSGFLPSPNSTSPIPPKSYDFSFDNSRIRRRTSSIAIKAQLSGITAPTPEDEESDFPSSEAELEVCINEWGLENLDESESWDPSPTVGEFMYGMSRDEDGF